MSDAQQLLQEREKRIQDAVALKKPDRVPIASMWDFFPAKWKGVTIKEVMNDYQLMFDLWAECMQHFPRTWLTIPTRFGVSGRCWTYWIFNNSSGPDTASATTAYQFVELEAMKADEYDHFLFDPSDFMVRRFWPRVNKAFAPFEKLPPLNQVISYTWGLHSAVFLLSPEMEAARTAMIEAGKASAEVLKWTAVRQKNGGTGFPPVLRRFCPGAVRHIG